MHEAVETIARPVGSHDVAAAVDPQRGAAAVGERDVDRGVALREVAPVMHEAVLVALRVPEDSHGDAAIVDPVDLGLDGAGDIDRGVAPGGSGALKYEAVDAGVVGVVSDDGPSIIDSQGPGHERAGVINRKARGAWPGHRGDRQHEAQEDQPEHHSLPQLYPPESRCRGRIRPAAVVCVVLISRARMIPGSCYQDSWLPRNRGAQPP